MCITEADTMMIMFKKYIAGMLMRFYPKRRTAFAVGIVVLFATAGSWLLSDSYAATFAGSSEAENGSLAGNYERVADSLASGGATIRFGKTSLDTSGPQLGALDPSVDNPSLYSAGFRERVYTVKWADIEPTRDAFSTTATADIQSKINNATSAGLKVSLDIGIQYAPAWIFDVGGGTQFKNQYGDVFTGAAGSGNFVPNAVTNDAVRSQLAAYLTYLGSHLMGIDSVRLGGAAYNELRYPAGSSGSQANSYWFYDESSQASLPSSLRGWKPSSGTTDQASQFITAYHGAMTDFGVWLAQTGLSAFASPVKLEMMLPGWGVRPGQVSSAISNKLNGTPEEVNQGLDWATMLPQLPNSTGRIVAYSTYADATQGGTSNPNPAEFIHSILPSGMLQGGESTGNGQTTDAGMRLMFRHSKEWNWYVVNWFFNGQTQTPQQLKQAFDAS
jgi:hypothetical protein